VKDSVRHFKHLPLEILLKERVLWIMSSLQPSYKLNIGVSVQPGMVSIGTFDGKHPALAVGTLGTK
jgi:hypothetical protein